MWVGGMTILKIKMGLLKSLKQIDKVLLHILLISVLSVIIMDIWLKTIPAPIKVLYSIGVLYYNVCLAYVASFVFYIVTVFLPWQRKRLSVYRYLNNKISLIYNMEMDLMNAIVNGSILRSSNASDGIRELEEKAIYSACKKINPHQPVVLVSTEGSVQFANYFQLLNFVHNDIKGNIVDLLNFEDCLSSETIELLTNIEDCFSQHINRTKGKGLGNKSLDIFSDWLWRLHKDTRTLMQAFRKDTSEIEKTYHRNFVARKK